MTNGRHAADDGSFQRSAGNAAVRGGLLIAVAVVLGLLLLNATDGSDPFGDGQVTAGTSEGTTTSTTPDDLAGVTTTVAPRAPAEVKVLVANGTKVQGAGAKWNERLQGQGYNVLSATNTREPATAAAVYYAEGFQPEAAVLAQAIGLPASAVQPIPTPSPVDDTRQANILVVLDEVLANQ